jgi:hypothetical protein
MPDSWCGLLLRGHQSIVTTAEVGQLEALQETVTSALLDSYKAL